MFDRIHSHLAFPRCCGNRPAEACGYGLSPTPMVEARLDPDLATGGQSPPATCEVSPARATAARWRRSVFFAIPRDRVGVMGAARPLEGTSWRPARREDAPRSRDRSVERSTGRLGGRSSPLAHSTRGSAGEDR